jgi:photosystem II stability/assembly factor-like uncharacterized protein
MSEITHTDYVYTFTAPADFGAGSQTCFAACVSGLMRSDDGGATWHNAYGELALQGPASTMAVVVPPDFNHEHLVVAGLAGGFLRSQDGGKHWDGMTLPNPPPTVSAMVISPDFAKDGMMFAATLEDGVFCSTNRGEGWAAWNFGLLDLNVLCLAISPAFAGDETLLAGTESGIFRSTNGGRAWREVELPSGFETMLALTFSPNYASDGVIYAGTETSGLFLSNDRGRTWQRLAEETLTGAVSAICPTRKGLLVLHDGEVLLSKDATRFTPWQAKALKDVEVTALYAANDLKPVLAGCAGGTLLRLE